MSLVDGEIPGEWNPADKAVPYNNPHLLVDKESVDPESGQTGFVADDLHDLLEAGGPSHEGVGAQVDWRFSSW